MENCSERTPMVGLGAEFTRLIRKTNYDIYLFR